VKPVAAGVGKSVAATGWDDDGLSCPQLKPCIANPDLGAADKHRQHLFDPVAMRRRTDTWRHPLFEHAQLAGTIFL
jgi:hypothetical protein